MKYQKKPAVIETTTATDEDAAQVIATHTPTLVHEGPERYAASTGRVCDREGCTSPHRHWHAWVEPGVSATHRCQHDDKCSCFEPRPQPEPDEDDDGDPTPLATLRNAITTWRERTNPDDDLARLFDYHEDAARIIACAVDLVAGEAVTPGE